MLLWLLKFFAMALSKGILPVIDDLPLLSSGLYTVHV